MQILDENGIHLNRDKCHWWKKEVKFLGWIIKNGEIHVDPHRIENIRDFPLPKTTTQLRAFLGLVNQILPAVPRLAHELSPITDLLKGRPRKSASIPWNETAHIAFENAKALCQNPSNLSSFDPALETYLYTDWSTIGIGGWVGQKRPDETEPHPIAFYSKKLKKSERNYAPYQGELFALTKCLDHFRQYLIGHPTILRFDQKALDAILTQKKLSPTQWRQISTILEFDLRPHWIPGHENTIADLLSRLVGSQDADTQTTSAILNNIDTSLLKISSECSVSAQYLLGDTFLEIPDNIIEEAKKTNYYKELSDYLTTDAATPPTQFATSVHHFKAVEGLIWFDNRLCIPPSLGKQLAADRHDHPSSIHSGIRKTVAELGEMYYWPNMVADIKKCIQECIKCQSNKSPTNPIQTPSYSHDAPNEQWTTIGMDFFTGLPEKSGFDSILTVTDLFSKRTRFIPCRKDDNAEITAQRFLANIYRDFGLPTKFVTDRDARWTSHFWEALCQYLGISQNISTAFHPQTDGQAENRHRTLSLWFRCLSETEKEDWTTLLPLAEFTMNNTPHSLLGMTPFEADCARRPRRIPDEHPPATLTPSASSFIARHQELSKYLKHVLESLQETNNIPPRPFRKDDMVMLKIRDFSPTTTAFKNSLRSPWIGPFRITGTAGLASYTLDLPSSWRFHGTFHASKLKLYHGEAIPVTRPPPIDVEGEPEFAIHEILMERTLRHKRQYLVSWLGYPLSEATWEPYESVKDTTAYKNYIIDKGIRGYRQ